MPVACPSKGIVRNSNYQYTGKIEDDGTVRDKNNQLIGYASGVPKTFAAIYFFFHSFSK